MKARRLALALLLLGLAPAAARADTICVTPAAGCDHSAATVTAGLAAAKDGDTVTLGAATYAEGGLSMPAGVTLRGAGAGRTTIRSPGAAGTTTLTAASVDDRVVNLMLVLPAGGASTGLALAGTASGVAVAGAAAPATNSAGVGVRLLGAPSTAVFAAGAVTLPYGATTDSYGVVATSGGGSVQGGSVTAGVAALGVATVARATLTGNVGVASGAGAAPTLDDDLIRVTPGSAAAATAIATRAGGTFRHLTLDGADVPGAVGLAASVATTPAVLRSSVLTGFTHDLTSDGAPVEVDYTDYNPFSATVPPAPAPGRAGAIADGGHGVRGVAPGFLDPASGNYRLRPDSPLIDEGDPGALAAGEPAVDHDGRPRAVAGRGGDRAQISDDGAYEFRPVPLAVTVRGPRAGTSGGALTFTAAAAPSIPGASIRSYVWFFGDGSSASGSRVTHRFRTPGVKVVGAVALDTSGVSGLGGVPVRIAAVPPRPVPAVVFPRIASRRAGGARIAYFLNRGVTLRVGVAQLAPRPLRLRNFHFYSRAGASTARLTGPGRAYLVRGLRYRITITPAAAGGRSRVVEFTATR